jgi:hypothetical protein
LAKLIDYYPTVTGQQFHECTSRVRGIVGPLGSGKSVACAIEIIKKAANQAPDADGVRKTRIAVIRNTYGQLMDTTFKTFTDWFPIGKAGHYVDKRHTYTLGVDKNGKDDLLMLPDGTRIVCEVLFRALDRPDQERNLLSLELTFAWINEFREVPFRIFQALSGRVARFPKKVASGITWSGIWMDSNPYDVDSEWYEFFENYNEYRTEKLEKEFDVKLDRPKIFRQPSGLAPLAENLNNLDGGRKYYLDLMASGKDEAWLDVHVNAKNGFIADGRPVYGKLFNQTLHTSEMQLQPIKGQSLGIGLDFGLTPAATIGQLAPNGQWLFFKELVADGLGALQFTKELKRLLEMDFPGYRYFCYGDPAGSQKQQNDGTSCFDVFAGANMPVMPSVKSVELRLDAVRAILMRMVEGTTGALFDQKGCPVIIKGFLGGYRYKRMLYSGERYQEFPLKDKFSHPHDSLQYLVAPFEVPAMNGGYRPNWIEPVNMSDVSMNRQARKGSDFNVFSV